MFDFLTALKIYVICHSMTRIRQLKIQRQEFEHLEVEGEKVKKQEGQYGRC